jgi:hypothetical protein
MIVFNFKGVLGFSAGITPPSKTIYMKYFGELFAVIFLIFGLSIAMTSHASEIISKKPVLNTTSNTSIEGFYGDQKIFVVPNSSSYPNRIILTLIFASLELPEETFFEVAMKAYYFVSSKYSMPDTKKIKQNRIDVVGIINDKGETKPYKYAITIPISTAQLVYSTYVEDIQSAYSGAYVYDPSKDETVKLASATQKFKEYAMEGGPFLLQTRQKKTASKQEVRAAIDKLVADMDKMDQDKKGGGTTDKKVSTPNKASGWRLANQSTTSDGFMTSYYIVCGYGNSIVVSHPPNSTIYSSPAGTFQNLSEAASKGCGE